jgi:hypothetical protein
MTRLVIHTVPSKSGWRNEREGADRALSSHATKAEAVQAGREQAGRDEAEPVIHNKDGAIAQRNSYGHDPRSRKG